MPITKDWKFKRPTDVDRGQKMTLEDAAEVCKVEAGWLRALVGRKKLEPVARYANPTRRYYSLLQIRTAIREERHGATQ